MAHHKVKPPTSSGDREINKQYQEEQRKTILGREKICWGWSFLVIFLQFDLETLVGLLNSYLSSISVLCVLN